MTVSTSGTAAFLAELQKAEADFAANAPIPVDPNAPPPPSISAALAGIMPFAADLQTLFATRPGAITAADDFFEGLKDLGCTWAAPLETAVNAMPGGVAMFEQYIPTIEAVIAEFAPAPQPIDKPPAR